MLEQIWQLVIQYISDWGYLGIFIGMVLESANIPIPSELIFGFAGYLVFLGQMDMASAVAVGVAGGLLGSIMSYSIGYYGGRPFVHKYGEYLFMPHNKVVWAQSWFDRHGIKAVFYGRLLPIIRTFISLPAGFAQVNFIQFVLYTVLGSIPWTIALIYAGMLLGENWHVLSTIGHEVSLIFGVVLLVAVLYYVWHNKRNSHAE